MSEAVSPYMYSYMKRQVYNMPNSCKAHFNVFHRTVVIVKFGTNDIKPLRQFMSLFVTSNSLIQSRLQLVRVQRWTTAAVLCALLSSRSCARN